MRIPLKSVSLIPLLLSIPLLVSLANEPPAKHWPVWRGPDWAGSVNAGSYAVKWSATDNLAWKVKLPGVGCSTPIVWGEHIFVTSPSEGQDSVLDFDWSGNLRWQSPIAKARRGKNRNGSGSNPSAVTDGTYVFAYYRSGNLAGLDFKGKVLWKTNLQKRFGDSVPATGVGLPGVPHSGHGRSVNGFPESRNARIE